MASRGDVVVITLNYRLGAFGFTHLAELGGHAASGNLGLLDQVAALQWVQEHAARFGGDPSNVTVFGESAGGTSIVALLAVPEAEGLFHRAVVQSASFSQLRSARRASRAARQLLAEAGATSADDLRALPLDALIAAQQRVLADPLAWFTAFSPVADGVVLPPSVDELLTAAAANPVPVLVGTARDEMQLFTALDPTYLHLDEATLVARATAVLGEAAPSALVGYRAARPGATPGQLATAIATDHGFRLPAIRFAEARLAAGRPTWMYWFTWPSPTFGGLLGACHGIELPFVFHNLDQPGVAMLTGTGAERVPLAGAVQAAWLHLARHGDPGWAPYNQRHRPTMQFDTECRVVDDPEGDLRRVWVTS
jgi:para-nitrobenzyl esterase